MGREPKATIMFKEKHVCSTRTTVGPLQCAGCAAVGGSWPPLLVPHNCLPNTAATVLALGTFAPSLCTTTALASAGRTERQLAPTRSACTNQCTIGQVTCSEKWLVQKPNRQNAHAPSWQKREHGAGPQDRQPRPAPT